MDLPPRRPGADPGVRGTGIQCKTLSQLFLCSPLSVKPG